MVKKITTKKVIKPVVEKEIVFAVEPLVSVPAVIEPAYEIHIAADGRKYKVTRRPDGTVKKELFVE